MHTNRRFAILSSTIHVSLAVFIGVSLLACTPPKDRIPDLDNPNVLYSEDHQDPIKKLQTNRPFDDSGFAYRQSFYVPVYSDIYVDNDNPKTLLSATLSIRNTSVSDSLYITKIDYYNTPGDKLKSYLDKPIELTPMGSLNYIIEKEDDTGGSGANFIVSIEAKHQDTVPVIQAVMIGHFSNKSFAFTSDAVAIATPTQ